MAKLIYASNMSLDGCTEDERGAFDWAPPDDDVFVFITELMRSPGTYLYGRRMYETLAVWETDATLANQSDLMADYASAWQAADKVVYSSTLAAPRTANTRLERHFDPSAVRELKAAASRDLLVGGPNLAAQAFVAGLVDELALFVCGAVVLGIAVAVDGRAGPVDGGGGHRPDPAAVGPSVTRTTRGRGRYFAAVDDGKSRSIRAWRLDAHDFQRLRQGQLVTVTSTPNLGCVRSIEPAPD